MRVAMTVQNIAGAAAGTGSESNDGTESDNQQNATEGTPASKGDDGALGEKEKAALDKERTARSQAVSQERRCRHGTAKGDRGRAEVRARGSGGQGVPHTPRRRRRQAAAPRDGGPSARHHPRGA